MSIHERLKYLREQLNLTTRVFGASINMSGGAITNMEKGMRNITDRTVRDICREYNINPDWLVNGNEPMCEDIVKDLDINEEVKQLSKQYSLLCDEDRELVKNIINSLSEKIKALHQTESATIQTETQTVPFLCESNPTHPEDGVELPSRPRELEYKKNGSGNARSAGI